MAKAPSFNDDDLVVGKGAAQPATKPATAGDTTSSPWLTPAELRGGVKALTIKLDQDTYQRLKIHGIRKQMTTQEMGYAAIRDWLDQVAEG